MHTVQLCLGFIAANAAAGEAVRMAARARRARQLVGKEILRCYQWILVVCSCVQDISAILCEENIMF